MNGLKRIFIGTAILTLAACGGGGGGGSAPPPNTGGGGGAGGGGGNTGGIGRTGLAVGPVSNFGSVVVNGVRYDTSQAVFTLDGAAGIESDLDIGDIVLVRGSIDEDGINGVADEVFYDEAVKGPIDSIDIANDRIVVLGQTVLINAETSFDDDFIPANIEGLTVGVFVEVSGLPNSTGEIIASRIEPESDTNEFEVTGFVANLDTAAQTFEINALTVDYATAMLEDFPNGEIGEGDLVEVEGSQRDANGVLIAEEVDFESVLPDLTGTDDVDLEISGLITRFASSTDFDVAGIPVTTNGDTDFENGTINDLALDVRVEVEGELSSEGVLVADDIEFRPEASIEIEAQIDSIDTGAGSFVVLGITVNTDASTKFEDFSSASLTRLTIENLSVGDYIEVAAVPQEGVNTVLARTVERDDDEEGEVVLEGTVTEIAEPSFTILGVTVTTDANTEFEFDDMTLTSAQFFDSLTVGDQVEVEGIESSDTVIAAETVELDD
ncbi:MAG: DUF5666 domain-containing protein [Pseudomonadota bacterium]